MNFNIAIGQFRNEMTDHVSWPRLTLVDHVMVLESQSKTTTETHQNTSFTIHPCLLHYIYDVIIDDVINDDIIVTWLILDQSDHTEKPPLNISIGSANQLSELDTEKILCRRTDSSNQILPNLKFRIFFTTLTVHFCNFVPFLLFIQNKQIN